MPRMKNPRVLLAGALLAVAVVVVTGVLAVGGSGGEGDKPDAPVRAKLTLEQYTRPDTGATELLVSLRETRLNTPDTTGGARTVLLRCVDEGGAPTIRARTKWPLLEESGYPFPHVHHLADRRLLSRVRGCRLTGPGIDFEGRVPGRLPAAAQ